MLLTDTGLSLSLLQVQVKHMIYGLWRKHLQSNVQREHRFQQDSNWFYTQLKTGLLAKYFPRHECFYSKEPLFALNQISPHTVSEIQQIFFDIIYEISIYNIMAIAAMKLRNEMCSNCWWDFRFQSWEKHFTNSRHLISPSLLITCFGFLCSV